MEWRMMPRSWGKDIGGVPQEIGTDSRSFWGRSWFKVGCCANDCCCCIRSLLGVRDMPNICLFFCLKSSQQTFLLLLQTRNTFKLSGIFKSSHSNSPSIYNYKGKAIPLQAWTGPKGSRRLRIPDFKTIGTWRW